jgi:hypothetical protein
MAYELGSFHWKRGTHSEEQTPPWMASIKPTGNQVHHASSLL